MPVEPVRPSTVVTREHPFFDPGAFSSVVFSGLVTEGTGPSLVQTTGIVVQLSATQPPLEVPGMKAVQDVSKSATRPVQGPGTSDVATQPLQAPGAGTATQPLQAPGAGTATQPLQAPGAGTATQPLQAPGAGTATQPLQAPGAGPEVLPTSNDPAQLLSGGRTVEIAGESESEPELDREPASPTSANAQGELPEDFTYQDLSEEANYRQTIRGVRSFMGWHQIPDFESASSSLDDNPFAGSRVKPTGKVSDKLPVDEWLCQKFERLNLTVAEGYPSRNTETGGLLRDQFVKPPRSSKWYDMHTDKKDSASTTVCNWSPEPAKLNSTFSRVARHSLPSAPASHTISQDTLRRWERAFREQSVMCNQAAGLSRCLTKVQDSMVTHLKTLQVDKAKGKAAERTQQAVEELEHLVTSNQSISQAMQRTMQDLSEGVFTSMANLTLARRDSYLEFLRGGVKEDTLTALRTSPVHLPSLFPDSLLIKAEDEIFRSEERRSSGSSHRKPGRSTHTLPQVADQYSHRTGSPAPAWKQIKDWQLGQKGRSKASNFTQKPAKGSKKNK